MTYSHATPPVSGDTTVTPGDPRADDAPPEAAVPSDHGLQPVKLLIGVLGVALTLWLMMNLFLAFAYYPQWFFNSKIIMGVLGLAVGVGGAALLFWFINLAIEALPRRLEHGLIPYA